MDNVSSSGDIRVKVGNGKVYSGELKVNKAASKWHMHSPLSIALPNTLDFKPIMLVKEYRKKAFFSNKKKSLFSILYSIFATIIFLLLFLYINEEKFLNLTLAGFVLAVYFTVEHFTISSQIKTLTDRNIFISSLSKNYKIHALKWLVICAFIGLIQTLLNYLGGEFDLVVYQYGGVYKSIIMGEWWRIFTASIFHSGFTHWFVNLALALIIGPLFISLIGSIGLFTFISGCVIGAISAFLLYLGGFTTAEAYGGISAGIYALLGYISHLTYKNKNLKTGKLYVSVINFLFMSTALSILLAPSTSNVAHISGFFVGVLFASSTRNKKT